MWNILYKNFDTFIHLRNPFMSALVMFIGLWRYGFCLSKYKMFDFCVSIGQYYIIILANVFYLIIFTMLCFYFSVIKFLEGNET